ncbi:MULTISPECIES: DUF423 domain-containing protein [Roseivirga]|jgi:uncharacterized membrane protein YgdD (TMEM256/DUF423 family)|uniref:DUF423 domain-containing protein n=1 Tax=Roseivirga spongicola TaxID=333140 RepID=A0A150XAF2_9BACT|nr:MULTISPECIES: DUF423 domain-containing protein [Roseivirga]PWL29301.1 MAG: DUF423 domain-containing protein [Roseivirga sp. XM-24bin3]KYG75693.1 hypothetical protein AWW68_07615 [Roseivirga spongicola]MBO6662459.1 DUF423 domain-containing protein [Roseivirga sp.]MBO6762176.1 DUF423 domain-containing protein [Roseivirga sp.]MBO6909977.1 DUF423 domain-containing protein [Roseivirga sp.]
MSAKLIIIIAGIFGALAVGLGAFGAHGLEATLTANGRLDTYETAVKYQFYHTLALLLTGILLMNINHDYFIWASWSFIIGMVIFSGSLYILSLTNVTWLGAITPIGGLALIVGWVFLILGASKAAS